MGNWQEVSYAEWGQCCDTLHALTQILGKVAVRLAPPEPQLQHGALRLSSRGIATSPLPAPNGSGTMTLTLDLGAHWAEVQHSGGERWRVTLEGMPVAAVTNAVLGAVCRLGGEIEINMTPQEVPWTTPLNEDEEHRHYVPEQASRYFAAATQAALVLREFRAPFRGRSTRVNLWWGSFDLAVNLFTGESATPPAEDFIMRNAMDCQEIALGWWPGDPNYPKAAFYAYAHPASEAFAQASLAPAPAAHWDAALGEFILDWSDVVANSNSHAFALQFLHSAFDHAAATCQWPSSLAATAQGTPPPIR